MDKERLQNRPAIETIRTGKELRRWYWLKEELVAHAKVVGVKSTGGKFAILERLARFVDTGETAAPNEAMRKPASRFDWHRAPLTVHTVITDNYKNTQNVRRFFMQNAHPAFKFNIAFMQWMKANVGKTLGDAVAEHHRQREAAAKPGFKSEIAPHNQFNQYTRDFLADNPNLGVAEARRYWARKKALPSANGRHVYDRSDLKL